MADPLMLEYRMSEMERRVNGHSESLRQGQQTVTDLRQEVALMGRDVAGILKEMQAERIERKERDEEWESRVKRLTIAWFSVAGSLIVGAVTLALTAANLG